jgi:hypothetical protein
VNRLHAQLLQTPKLLVGVEDDSLELLGEILERDLTPHPLVGLLSAPQFAAPVRSRIPAHGHIGILAWLLEIGEARKHGCVAFGDHAAGIVASHVARDAVRQQTFTPVPRTQERNIHQCHGPRFATTAPRRVGPGARVRQADLTGLRRMNRIRSRPRWWVRRLSKRIGKRRQRWRDSARARQSVGRWQTS